MPASPEVLYASLLRPFPTRALANALRPVQAQAYALDHALTEMLIQPPTTPEAWEFELTVIEDGLWNLYELCDDAAQRVVAFRGSADRDFQAAISAARAMLAGLSVSGEGASLGSFEADSGPGDDAGGQGLRTPANDPEAGR
jgi:hypothetical protein